MEGEEKGISYTTNLYYTLCPTEPHKYLILWLLVEQQLYDKKEIFERQTPCITLSLLLAVKRNLFLFPECCFHTFNTNMMAAQKTTSFENELAESASPQGIQGTPNMEMGCGHFQAWLDNCRRYGLSNCDQQLQV